MLPTRHVPLPCLGRGFWAVGHKNSQYRCIGWLHLQTTAAHVPSLSCQAHTAMCLCQQCATKMAFHKGIEKPKGLNSSLNGFRKGPTKPKITITSSFKLQNIKKTIKYLKTKKFGFLSVTCQASMKF